MKVAWSIRRIVDAQHISTPYEDIALDIRKRGAHLAESEPQLLARFQTQAVIRQRQNRADYTWVMGSH